MTRKGVTEEIFSKALFADKHNFYKIFFRDFEQIKELTLPEFLVESDYFQTIPANRIKKIKRNSTILFERNTQGVED